MGRISRILPLALVVLVLPYVYIAWSLNGPWWPGWILLAAPFVAVLAMPLVVFTSDRHADLWWRDLAVNAAHFGMGFTTYLAVFTVSRDLVWALGVRIPTGFVFASTFFTLALAALIAHFGPRVKHVKIPIDALGPEVDGLRVVQISDLHVGNTIAKAYVERAVKLANAFQPDLIALTGDIADGSVVRHADDIEPLRHLAAPMYYVPGNHEYYWNFPAWADRFRSLGCTVLINEGVRLPKKNVFVAGITDPAAKGFGAEPPDVARAARGGDDAKLKLLLSHRPDFAAAAAEHGFHAQLSGHTHGGQFFPWTLVVRYVHEFHSGLHRIGRFWIYVSVGTGTWGPQLRLGTTPELTAITFVRHDPRYARSSR